MELQIQFFWLINHSENVTVELPQSDWLFLPLSDGWSVHSIFKEEPHAVSRAESTMPSPVILFGNCFLADTKDVFLCHVLVFWRVQDSPFPSANQTHQWKMAHLDFLIQISIFNSPATLEATPNGELRSGHVHSALGEEIPCPG